VGPGGYWTEPLVSTMSATTFSIAFPIVFKSAIGVYALGVLYKSLPGLLITIVLALFKKGGRCSSLGLELESLVLREL
jgi:hypothetical protein